jgi:exodeoxyribonuclease-3
VLCLQELKCVDQEFPFDAVRALGYYAAVYGQKTYNGVAIVSRVGLDHVRRGFDDGGDEDPHRRVLRADCGGLRVVNVYVPNGQDVGTDKFAYKLEWLTRLRRMLDAQESATRDLVLVGDFNIVPENRDMWNPDAEGSIFSTAEERAALAAIQQFGFDDCLRRHDSADDVYTWWDYRMLAYPKRRGLRIDLVLATASLAERSTACVVDRSYRKRERPSDHAPVIADFA